jgi:hypothetical protein
VAATLIPWLARPALFDAAFGGARLWPVLGIVFLPVTRRFSVVLWSPAGLVGWDWFWLALAFFLDLGGAASSGSANRDRMPGSSPAPAPAG